MNNSLNLQEIDQEQALNLCKFYIQSNQNTFLFGRKGTGKTAIILQAAKEANMNISLINLSVVERTDLAGYPNLHEVGDVVTFKSPCFLPVLFENQKPNTVLVFDEVDKAPPEVTSPLLEILLNRTINGKKLNAVSCMLTGNLACEKSYSNTLSTALLDRGAKYILKFNFDKWFDWAKLNGIHDLILGFLRSNKNYACGEDNDTRYASPSPRSWHQASDALFLAKKLKIVDADSISDIVTGFVGVEAGFQFKMWYEHYRKFEGHANCYLENKGMSIDFDSLHPTEKLIFVITLCFLAKSKTLERLNAKNKFEYLENLCLFFNKNNVDLEVQLMGLYNSFDFEFITKNKLYKCVNFYNLFDKLTKTIKISN